MRKNKKKIKKNKKKRNFSESTLISMKNSRKRLIKWMGIVLMFVIVLLISVYFISPYRLLEDVYVTGTDEVYDQEILDSSGLKSGESIWENYLNKSDIELQIEKSNPQIKNVKLTLSDIQDFTLIVKEYKTVAYLSEEQTYKKILENGEILDASVANLNSTHPILHSFEKGTVLVQFLDEYKKLDDNVKKMVSEIEFLRENPDKRLVQIFMNDGNEVLVTIPSFSDRLNYYQEMREAVDQKKGLFDLEAGAYFRPFSSEEETEMLDDVE